MILAPFAPAIAAAVADAVTWTVGILAVAIVGTKAVDTLSKADKAANLEQAVERESDGPVETSERCPEKNKERCNSLKRSIENKEKEILKRQGEMHEDVQELPWRAPGDELKPSLSRWGHQQIIEKLKADLAADKAMYQYLGCGDPYGEKLCPP